ncbi:MAG: alpha-glucan family phosphorylase [Rikenellaceae bacterium]|jgi:phosphorylase/glycogen(starch) synthase|nr:alpha-glucan family phosphorylase [Rikenellaceae bacterium]
MSKKENLSPSCLFEVSWEVCNKVGGIHTVVATKALTMTEKLGDKYILIGPDIHSENLNPEFEEDCSLMRGWRQQVYNDGIRIKIGRWRVKGNPIAILIDFSSYFSRKDDVLKFLWESYKVDSISGQWDYIEPVLFGYAAGRVIESYIENFCSVTDSIAAHFHEWMTSSGGLYLRKNSPYVATVFTTHATVMGRSLAGNGLPLYGDLQRFNADEYARMFNVVAKHSLEKTAATNYDCFATVSDITATECRYLLGREVDVVTPNGFEDDFVWPEPEFSAKRAEARGLMVRVAEACLGTKFDSEPLIVGASGRYEFRNKGIDLFMEALKVVAARNTGRPVLAYITVPAGNNGPRKDLRDHLADPSQPIDRTLWPHATHYLSAQEWDPVANAMKDSALLDPASNVRVIFVPSYLNGNDGIFDKGYYELLAGMDVTVFASYYEPWGYTPLESIAFSVPTVTTTLAGFGLWVDSHLPEHKGVEVLARTDDNDGEIVEGIAASIVKFAAMEQKIYALYRSSALEISKIALWENLVAYYDEAYRLALHKMTERSHKLIYSEAGAPAEQINFVRQQIVSNTPRWISMIVEKRLPDRLAPLDTLSKNLWWSWTLGAHELFEYIDPKLWAECEKNPIDFLDNLSFTRMQELEHDGAFLARMDEVYAHFTAYMAEKKEAKGPKIAYFSMEYGLHHSLKIYSGGLGILAGDYLKEASDMNVPMVAVGLLYKYGYFTQRLSAQGMQEAAYETQNFSKLPVTPVRDAEGNWSSIRIAFPGRTVTARIWKCEVGRTELYLLDTDHELNLEEDRSITHHLYGGDWENRLKQELLLGVGGIRTLRELGIRQDVFHCNEGHAAFIGLERIYNLIAVKKLLFSEALEVVRASSLFTTHTPVPAGHDAFPESMIRQYMSHYPDRLGITWEQFVSLGRTTTDPNERFSMSFLACNLSQEVNGVSWLHGEVSKEILGSMWPGYFKDELHIGYVTNGVHFPTWTAGTMRKLYMKYFAEGFSGKEYNIPMWQRVHDISDGDLWDQRMHLKKKLVNYVRKRAADPTQIRFSSPNQMVRIMDSFKPETLTIGFARRFATYKRAHLLFTDLERLARIVNNPDRPVQFVFAGKAHPNDKPGQELIKRIVEVSVMPQFVGKVIFLQNYDIDLARKLVQGVDVWLNTPTRPLEASGTSGEKCVMNGVLQFSVLDGWWVEGYREGAGWMLPMERTFTDQRYQDEMDAEMIYNTIEQEIAPLYYSRNAANIPEGWVATVKRCVADVASNFTTNRMLADYRSRFYDKLFARKRSLVASDYRAAREIAAWKRRVSAAWDKINVVSVKQFNVGKEAIVFGRKYNLEVVVDINGLSPDEIGVEMVVATKGDGGRDIKIIASNELRFQSVEGRLARYTVDSMPDRTGYFELAMRVFPKNPMLPHRMDFALVKWA